MPRAAGSEFGSKASLRMKTALWLCSLLFVEKKKEKRLCMRMYKSELEFGKICPTVQLGDTTKAQLKHRLL